ncbi:MAG: molybdate ABC transporter substrate-binding protein [Candidatus Sulfotelmatobacter sp.]
MPKHRHVLLAVGIALLSGVPRIAHSAEIKVLSDGPLEPALTQAAEAFRRESSHTAKFVFGLSPVIHKRVMEGESADVIIIQPNFIDELVKARKLEPGEHPVVGRVGIGLFVRAGVAVPDISTPAALKQGILSADALVFNNVASGNYFATMLERLDLAETMKGKIARVSPADVVARILEGKGRDIGVGVVPLILKDKRLTLAGPLPGELQSYLVYAAAIATNAASPDAGKDFFRFLASPAARVIFKANGAD